jgi:hypothetical protein
MKTHPLPNYTMLPTTHLLVTLLCWSVGYAVAGIAPGRTPATPVEIWPGVRKMAFEKKSADFPIKPRFHKMSFGTLSNNLIKRIDLTYHRVTSLYDMTFGLFRV